VTEVIVSMTGIGKDFAGVTALHDIDLSIAAGEICCLVGENGSGKSTLIKILAGVHAPSSGEFVIAGEKRDSYRPSDALREGIQVIFQDFSLFPNLSVAENIAFASEISGRVGRFSRSRAAAVASTVLDRMNITLDLDARAGDLPMVDRQLVAIAAALVTDARLIVMDEPTTALSQREVQALLAVVKGLKAEGISTLFVSHKLDEVAEISDHTVVLRNGTKVADAAADAFDRAALVTAMTGRAIEYGHNIAVPVSDDVPVLLELDGISRPGCFDDVSLTLRPGEIVGITGLLGSGRDTLALSLFGMLPPTSGTISIGGAPVTLNSVQDAIAHGIGFVPEDRLTEGLFLDHSIKENIIVRTIGSIRNRFGLLDVRRALALAHEWVANLTIKTPTVTQAVSTLSGGNQQRVVLAKWLSAHPRILVLNGPTVGVDIGSKTQILDLLRELAGNGMGIIVISDDIPELLDVCHRILLMRGGTVTDTFDRADITEQSLNTLLVAS
jgi:simple sugar transport system ATP-binding protein